MKETLTPRAHILDYVYIFIIFEYYFFLFTVVKLVDLYAWPKTTVLLIKNAEYNTIKLSHIIKDLYKIVSHKIIFEIIIIKLYRDWIFLIHHTQNSRNQLFEEKSILEFSQIMSASFTYLKYRIHMISIT